MYVILGATGHTGKRITEQLLAAGKAVTAVTRDAGKAQELADKGAVIAVGDLCDYTFLQKTFEGATAVYTLVPPKWDVQDWRSFQMQAATAIGLAISAAGVKHVVNLSSLGAHLPEGAGPVSGLYYLEQILNNIPGLTALHLRPGYFYENLYSFTGMIQHMGVIAQPVQGDFPLEMAHTSDIADAAAQYLLDLNFKHRDVVYVAGPKPYTFDEVAQAVSAVAGKQIPFVTSTPQEAAAGMTGMGMPQTIADGYVDLYHAIQQPAYRAGFARGVNVYEGRTALEQFVEQELKHALAQ